MIEMNKTEIIKNKLDLEFRQKLQEHASILNARWSIPFVIGLAFFSKFPDVSFGVFSGISSAFLVFISLNNYRKNSEQDLNGIKRQIKSLVK